MPEITIAGHKFEVSSPYSEGHPLTAGEASQLNQVRHENVRNNFAKKVKEAIEGGSPDYAALASEVASYDQSYAFGIRKPGAIGVSRDPVLTEARSIARSAIKSKLKAAGREATKEQIATAIETLLASDNGAPIMELARKRVAETADAANAALAGGFEIPEAAAA